MKAFAAEKGWKGGDFKKLNKPFENKLLGRPKTERDRMAKGVEDFVYNLIANVFNAADTAPLAVDLLLKAGFLRPGPQGFPRGRPCPMDRREHHEKGNVHRFR